MFRIGVNLGDVVVEGDDLLGDGVNVAARLEQLCEPGGVLISGTAYDHLKGKLDLALEPRGEQRLKNIGEPVRAYRVRMEPVSSARLPARSGGASPMWRWVAAASLALLVLVGLAAWLRPWQPTVEAASVERMAFPLPDKPSLAVLPFRNVSGEPEQDYFVDGLTDDLITDLSKVSGLFIIARDSVFPFKGRDAKVRDVAESLGVRYVVDGSVRRAGNTVRVNVQLIDALTGGQLWADRYDGGLDDIFAVQDKLVRVIVDALALKLSKDEEREIGRGQTHNVDAREAFQRGWERILRFTSEDNASAVADLRRAIELDPDYGRAYTALGLALFRSCAWGWTKPRRHEPVPDLRDGVAVPGRGEAAPVVADPCGGGPHQPELPALRSRLHRGGAGAGARPQRSRSVRGHGVGHDHHGQAASGARLHADGDAAQPQLPEPLRPRPRLGAVLVGRARRGRARARGSARAQPDRDRAGAAARRDLRPPRAEERGARHAAEMEAGREPGGAERHTRSPIPYTYRWSADGQKALDRLIDGMIIAALPLDITVPELADALQQGGAFERARAARTLARFGPQAADAVPALVRALDDPSRVVRSAAITALGRIGPKAKAAVPALAGIRDAELRPLADDAVKEIDGR